MLQQATLSVGYNHDHHHHHCHYHYLITTAITIMTITYIITTIIFITNIPILSEIPQKRVNLPIARLSWSVIDGIRLLLPHNKDANYSNRDRGPSLDNQEARLGLRKNDL